MLTKKEAESMAAVLVPVEQRALKDPAVAIGFVLSRTKPGGKDIQEGYCPTDVMRTLYRAAGIKTPDTLKTALRRKEPAIQISKQDLMDLAIQAARGIGADNIADSIIAGQRDMPVRPLATVFPKGSDIETHTRQLAAQRAADQEKSIADFKAAGAIDVRIKIPTYKQVANEFVLGEIFRFAAYNKLAHEVDFQRSKVTKRNIIHLCCSDIFVEALENARVPGVGQFVSGNPVASSWPYSVDKLATEKHLWPFP